MNHQPSTKSQPSTKRSAFTLIELLVVVAIIGVLFAVAMPIFENAGRKNTERAAYQLISTMRLARQHAISKRQWTIVVFPDNNGGSYSGANGDTIDKCLRSYAVLAVTNIQNVAGKRSVDELERAEQMPINFQFAFVSDWKYLPEGIYFDDNKDFGQNNVFFLPALPASFRYPVDPANPNNKVRTMGAVMFRPNGRAYAQVFSSKGNWWQDTDTNKMKIFLTSTKYYEPSGGGLGVAQIIPGTSTVVRVRNKTGQVQIED